MAQQSMLKRHDDMPEDEDGESYPAHVLRIRCWMFVIMRGLIPVDVIMGAVRVQQLCPVFHRWLGRRYWV